MFSVNLNHAATVGARGMLHWVQNALSSPLSAEELAAPALVVAPHADDETLGCGGTVALKILAGADVHVIVMTDGAQSHAGLIAPDELSAIRAAEAVRATGILGVPPGKTDLLGFPDGHLAEHHARAVDRVLSALEDHRPAQVFIPYRRAEHIDHVATHDACVEALRRSTLPRDTQILDYPVWFWNHWPWVPVPNRGRRSFLKATLDARVGLVACREFRTSVDIRSVLATKRAALNAYQSQMTQLNRDPQWSTLPDVSDGQFIAAFFRRYELFRRHTPR